MSAKRKPAQVFDNRPKPQGEPANDSRFRRFNPHDKRGPNLFALAAGLAGLAAVAVILAVLVLLARSTLVALVDVASDSTAAAIVVSGILAALVGAVYTIVKRKKGPWE